MDLMLDSTNTEELDLTQSIQIQESTEKIYSYDHIVVMIEHYEQVLLNLFDNLDDWLHRKEVFETEDAIEPTDKISVVTQSKTTYTEQDINNNINRLNDTLVKLESKLNQWSSTDSSPKIKEVVIIYTEKEVDNNIALLENTLLDLNTKLNYWIELRTNLNSLT